MHNVLIIVLNWNGKENTLNCLSSLILLDVPLLVVDNGSTDGSVQAFRSRFPDLSILETGANLGYAGGNNEGIRWGLTKSFEWFLILNNDTVVPPDLIERLLETAQSMPSEKLFGAKICTSSDSRIEHLGGFWSSSKGEFLFPHAGTSDHALPNEPMQVDTICGCALFMHRTLPEQIGLFEEPFFLLWEESDFCARARRAGFSVWIVPKAKVFHKRSASFTGGKPHLQYFWWRNRLLWISRNCSFREKRTLYIQVLIPEIIRLAKHALLKTLQTLFSSNPQKKTKARCYRAGLRGVFHYFIGRFGDCPAVYKKTK